MNAWTVSQLALFAVALLLAFVGERFSISILTYSGISLFGVCAFLVGMEAALTSRIVLGRRRYDETIMGLAAYAQGVQFMIIGAFFVGVSIFAYFDVGRNLSLYFVRRPGTLLLTFGIYCLMQTVIVISGYEEEKHDTRWIAIMNLFVSRLLPGLILVAIGLGATGLGLLEIFAPTAFDNIGGGFLEVLYGLR